MDVPSIKGAVLDPPFSCVQQCLASGKLCEDDLAPYLDTDYMDLFAHGADATSWYPIDFYDSLARVLRDSEGAGDDRFYPAFGAREAETVLSHRPVQALVRDAGAVGMRADAVLAKLADFAFNFGDWRYTGTALSDFSVEASGVGPLPESLRLVLEGFMSSLASRLVGQSVSVTSVRPTRDWICYTGLARQRSST
jgi:hypothetical protein